MKIAIDPPPVRSLSGNEKKVYQMLREGLDCREISKRMHIPVKLSCLTNYRDVPPDTVMGLVTSIREKGWECTLPEETKEETEMGKSKTPPEKLEEIRTLKEEGKTNREIAKAVGVSTSTVTRTCTEFGLSADKHQKAEEDREAKPPAGRKTAKHTFSPAALELMRSHIIALRADYIAMGGSADDLK